MRDGTFDFANLLNEMFDWDKDRIHEDIIFHPNDINILKEILIDKAIKEAKGISLFEKYPRIAPSLFFIWHEVKGADSLMKYIKKELQRNPKLVFDLIKVFCRMGRTLNAENTKLYFADLEITSFEAMKKLFDLDYLQEKINQASGRIVEASINDVMKSNDLKEKRILQFIDFLTHPRSPQILL